MLLYFDPGSGSLLLQIIIAAFVSILSFSKKIKISLRAFFKTLFKQKIKKE